MIETYDAEIFVVEKEEATVDIIKAFIGFDLPHTYLVITEKGRYVGFLDAKILQKEIKKERFWCSDVLACGEDLYLRAREYFAMKENREMPLPVVNEREEILTFLVWNQQDERCEDDLRGIEEKVISLLKAGHRIELRDWDEYTGRYWSVIQRDGRFVDNVRCTGRNWEICGREADTQEEESIILIDKSGIYYPTSEKDVIPLYCLREREKKYRNKRIYMWLNSCNTLSTISVFLIQYGYMIDGFFELRSERNFDEFLGKPVENLEDILQEDILFLPLREAEIAYLEQVVPKEKMLSYGQMLGWDFKTMSELEFQACGTDVECKEFKKETAGIDSKVVINKGVVDNERSMLLLWEYMVNKGHGEYVDYMKTVNWNVPLYSKNKVFETSGNSTGISKVVSLDQAIKAKKKFIIYGIESRFTNQWMHILDKLHVSYELMDDDEIENWYGYRVTSVFELPYYDIKNIFVIINKPYEKLGDSVHLLMNYGISFEKRNAISVYEIADFQHTGKYITDLCAGPISQALAQGEYPCYRVWGNNLSTDYKIMVLGGSTSSEYLFTYKTWAELLEKKFRKGGKSITIYNGAAASYGTMQELSKLIRDIRCLKPDLVISFSGVNDIWSPYWGKEYVNGLIPLKEERFENYLLNEEMMFEIANKFHAEFLCIVQPQLWFNKEMNNYEKVITKPVHDERNRWLEAFEKNEKHPWMINMMQILDGHDVFIDTCHVTTEGNEIIAQHIYELIKDKVS